MTEASRNATSRRGSLPTDPYYETTEEWEPLEWQPCGYCEDHEGCYVTGCWREANTEMSE